MITISRNWKQKNSRTATRTCCTWRRLARCTYFPVTCRARKVEESQPPPTTTSWAVNSTGRGSNSWIYGHSWLLSGEGSSWMIIQPATGPRCCFTPCVPKVRLKLLFVLAIRCHGWFYRSAYLARISSFSWSVSLKAWIVKCIHGWHMLTVNE